MNNFVKTEYKSKKPRTEFEQYYDDSVTTKYTIQNSELSKKEQLSKRLREETLHPSSFPYCGLRHAYKIMDRGGYSKEFDYSIGNYYLEMGTAVHTFMQKILGYKGQIKGDWKCVQCNTIHENVTYPESCSKCKNTFFEYEEVGGMFLDNISWHKDGIFVNKKHKHYSIDYKTTYVNAITKHEKEGNVFPYSSNKFQLESYAVIYESVYNIPVHGWKLIYQARDFPHKKKIIEHDFEKGEKENILARLSRWDKNFSIAKKFLNPELANQKRLNILSKNKLCCDKHFYTSNVQTSFDSCPLAGVCFNKVKLNKELTLKLEEYTNDNSQ